MKRILLPMCLVVLLAQCGPDATSPVSKKIINHLVLLKAEASDFQTSSVTWYNSGNPNSPSGSAGFTGSWALYFANVTSGTTLSLTVSGANPTPNPYINPNPVRGSLKATIVVDGNVWKEEFGAGVTTNATASGTIP